MDDKAMECKMAEPGGGWIMPDLPRKKARRKQRPSQAV